MLNRNALITIALALGAGVLGLDGGYGEDVFWIVTHDLPLVSTRLDPIMTPGDVSGHVHAIVGGSNFGATYDYDHSLKSECTTANIKVDHSNYWVPQLYIKNADGSLSAAELDFVQTYYQMRRVVERDSDQQKTFAEPVYEFPPGFRMLAGDPDRRTLDLNDPAQAAIQYVCLGDDVTYTNEFPTKACTAGMRAQIYFPHCWDGVNNWLEGSKHVSYGAEGAFDQGGKCPPTHPKRIMGLFYEFIFKDHEKYTPGARLWSNGDDVGHSFHADFTNGWPVGYFSEIFSHGRECSVGFDLKTCPPLARELQKDPVCPYSNVRVLEDIGDDKPIARLPGNNPRNPNYVETAKFDIGSPSPTNDAAIPASSIAIGTVLGDPAYSAAPDAVSQSGATAITSQSAAATSAAISSGYSAVGSAQTGSATSAQPASTASALPGGGGALIGVGSEVASDAYPSETDASPAGPSASTSSVLGESAESTPGVPAPASSTGTAARPAKSCGRSRNRGGHRSVY